MKSEEQQQQRLRLFCAVEIPLAVRAEVEQYISRWRESFPRVNARWERAEKMHLTLKFLGEVESERIASLTETVSAVAASVSCFPLGVAGTGAFPPRGAPRVLWLGVRPGAAELQALHESLEDNCTRLGFARETRQFRPHLTIARIKETFGGDRGEARQLTQLHAIAKFSSASFIVRELVLIKSELHPGGSIYTPLSRHLLAANLTEKC